MDKVISNVDVLYEIFQYLNLEELLKLTKVCSQFRMVIVDFIWRNKYKHLEICKTSQHFGLLLTNNVSDTHTENEIGFEYVKEEKAVLNRSDIEFFFKLIVNNIQQMVLCSPATMGYKRKEAYREGITRRSNPFLYNPTEFGVKFDKKFGFVNLRRITFRHVMIGEKDLRLLNESSRKLESMCLDNCFNINEQTLLVGDDIKITTLRNMKNLKYFKIIVFDTVEKDLSYDLSSILSDLNMKQLVIKVRNFSLIDANDDGDGDGDGIGISSRRFANFSNKCEELTIGYFRSQRIFRKFNNLILSNFKSLKKLILESWALISIDEEFFKKITKTCSQLEYLKLQNFEIQSFAVVPTLNSLILENCCGLMWRDVKAMLGDMKLATFSILDTEYMGIFEYFNVADTLKHLLVINCQRNHFKKLFDINNGQNLRNLTCLVWHDNFAQLPIYVATSCPQLKTLITEPTSLLINNIYDLRHLENLTLRVGRKIKFSRIMIILKHSNLKYFTLTKLEGPDGYDEYNDYLIDYDIYEPQLIEFEERKLSLTFLNLSLNNYFKISQEFWFNLLKNNPKLTIMIRYNRFLHKDHNFLTFIINHRKFPKRLKSIKVCGFRIEIKEFRDNFDTAIEKINAFSNVYKDDEDKGYILL